MNVIDITPPEGIVICDSCNEDYTNSEEQGGILVLSRAICPRCEMEWRRDLAHYNEQRFLRAECPKSMSFRDWVCSLRGEKTQQKDEK